jgi:hypothetical protein
MLKMLTVEAQLIMKMDPRSEIATPLFKDPWGVFLPHFSQWPRYVLRTLVPESFFVQK